MNKTYMTTLQPVVVVVDPLLPDYWGESASVVLWGFAASFSRQSSSRAATPEGSLHKSRAEHCSLCDSIQSKDKYTTTGYKKETSRW